MGLKVFLSHSSQDKNVLGRVVEETKRLGVSLYLYEHDLQPGTPIAAKIKKEIAESDLFVVVLTKQSQYSAYVQQEIGLAEGANKPIVPLVESGVEDRNLAMLKGIEYVEFDPASPDKSVSKLQIYLRKRSRINKDDLIAFLLVLVLIITGLALVLLLLGRKKGAQK